MIVACVWVIVVKIVMTRPKAIMKPPVLPTAVKAILVRFCVNPVDSTVNLPVFLMVGFVRIDAMMTFTTAAVVIVVRVGQCGAN